MKLRIIPILVVIVCILGVLGTGVWALFQGHIGLALISLPFALALAWIGSRWIGPSLDPTRQARTEALAGAALEDEMKRRP